MRTLGNLLSETLKLHGTNPWRWLYEVVLEQTTISSPTAYLAASEKDLTWGGKTWRAASISHEPIREDKEGNLLTIAVHVSNVGRVFTPYVERSKGMAGMPLTIYLVHEAHLASGDHVRWKGVVRGVTVTDELITVSVGLPMLTRIVFPQFTYARDRCGWRFKSDQCCYSGSNTFCTKRLDGTNGCTFHGDDEEANDRPRLHPANFGGFPGIPRQRR